MKLLTRLTKTILRRVADGNIRGAELRTILDEAGYPKSGPAFYAVMADLTDAGLVESIDAVTVIGFGTKITQRWFSITDKGREALNPSDTKERG